MKYVSLLLVLLPAIMQHHVGEGCNFTALAKALIRNDENKYQLSRAFFPPTKDAPEFVTVHYNITTKNQTWYWSRVTSSFIHPPKVIQFMSLLFIKPYEYFNQEVWLILEGVPECAEDLEKMQFLTQRLQLFAAKPVYPLKVDSSYQAKAYIDKQYTNNMSNYTIEKQQRDNRRLIDATLIIAIIFTVVTTFVIGFLFIMSKQHHWAEKMEKKKPLVCSIAVVSLLINIFNATMSVNSVYHWANNNTATRQLHNNYDSAVTSVVVAMFFVFDAFHLFIFCIIIPVTYWLHYNQEFKKDKLSTATTSNKQQETTRNRGNERTSLINSNEQNLSHEKYDELSTDTSENSGQSSIDKPILPWYVLLSFTIFGPVASVMAHSPYIIIGYINDGHHAGSMFIYYMVVIGFAYSICWVGFYPQGFTQPKSSKAGEYKSTNKILGVAAILAFIGYFAIVTSITIFFVKIPINKSISDAPDQLAGIYKSGGFVIFSFVTYKMITFFYKSNKPTGIETAITEHKTPLKSEQSKWDTMSDDEKIKEIYDVVVDIVSKYYENMNQK